MIHRNLLINSTIKKYQQQYKQPILLTNKTSNKIPIQSVQIKKNKIQQIVQPIQVKANNQKQVIIINLPQNKLQDRYSNKIQKQDLFGVLQKTSASKMYLQVNKIKTISIFPKDNPQSEIFRSITLPHRGKIIYAPSAMARKTISVKYKSKQMKSQSSIKSRIVTEGNERTGKYRKMTMDADYNQTRLYGELIKGFQRQSVNIIKRLQQQSKQMIESALSINKIQRAYRSRAQSKWFTVDKTKQ